jgi:hypothetical protein
MLNRPLPKLSGWSASSQCPIPDRSAKATSRLPIEGTTICSRIAPGSGSGNTTGFAAARDRLTAHTSQSALTSGRTISTAFHSNARGKQGTLLPCQTCSIHDRRNNTIGRPLVATNRTADSGCEGRMGRGSSVPQAHDPKRLTIASKPYKSGHN